MQYAQFADLFEQVKSGRLQPGAAARELQAQRSAAEVADEVFRGDEPYLADHRVDGQPVLIGVTYASLAIERFFAAQPDAPGVLIRNLEFVRPVAIARGTAATIRPALHAEGDGRRFEALYCAPGAAPEVVATARASAQPLATAGRDLPALQATLEPWAALDSVYAERGGLVFGDSYRTLASLHCGPARALARVVLPTEAGAPRHRYLLHPLFINSAFLAVQPLVAGHHPDDLFLPFGIREIHCSRAAGLQQGWLVVDLVKKTDELLLFDVECFDDQSQRVARLQGCALKRRRSARTVATAAAAATPQVSAPAVAGVPAPTGTDGSLRQAIQRYLTEKIARLAGRPPQEIDPRRNIMDMGLESAQIVEMGSSIQNELGIELFPTLFFEYTNIDELTGHFFEQHRSAFQNSLPAAPEAAPAPAPAAPQPLPLPAEPAVPAGREPIAIIGVHARLPGSANLEEFWTHLCQETELMREVPADHWDTGPWFDADPAVPDKTYCKWGSFIDGVDEFDAPFFNIARREAEWIDPQVRLLLQSVYAAAEDAGCAGTLRGSRTGVFVGACFHDYQHKIDELQLPINPHVGVNNTHTVMANRVSYHFNLVGPSVTVDTACSSSLVALHQACQSLHAGECELALVSGANLLLSSVHYRVFSSLKALSPTGRCHTFDASADGYVPGECVATVVLKPLSQAVRDGDRIQAVIRGSAALHGGYTPSLTAPSVPGEENVILRAWQDAGIDPETLGYVEAHGTGTKLGDPIEINALKSAFARHTPRQGFCSVGSVKANIGHTEGAAGIAGMLKVMLQMKHGQIPPLMGFKTLNPYIVLDGSALRIDARGAAWEQPPGVPRRAGISSFGVAGAYAHVVLEEYLEPAMPAAAVPPEPALVVLSAKTEAALAEHARQLLHHVQQGQLSDSALHDAAATLQQGREALEWRLGVAVRTTSELAGALSRHLNGEPVPGLHAGRSSRAAAEAPLPPAPTPDDLLRHWVAGGTIEWPARAAGWPRRVVNLPTYPFARERYWVPAEAVAKAAQPAAPRPQPQAPVSPATAHTRLDGTEFFLADHRVNGSSVLPGVVHLELARAALATAAGTPGCPPWALTDVVWSRPVMANGPVELQIETQAEAGGWRYEVASSRPGGERVLHSRGRGQPLPGATREKLDLAAWRARCNGRVVAAAECYAGITALGLDLGPRLQGIERLYLGPDCLLAELRRPAQVPPAAGPFGLHPSLVDPALQACATLLMAGAGPERKLALPYALQRLEVHAPCTDHMWASLRLGARTAEGQPPDVDIDLCDAAGTVCVRLRGLSFRFLQSAAALNSVLPAAPAATLLTRPEWRLAPPAERLAPQRHETLHQVFCDLDPAVAEAALALCRPEQHLRLSTAGLDAAEAAETLATTLLGHLQGVFDRAGRAPLLLQFIFTAAAPPAACRAIGALLKSAQAENSKFRGQVIELAEPDAGLSAQRLQIDALTADLQIAYRDGQRRVLGQAEVPAAAAARTVPWRDHGQYLITGGAGELGLAMAEEIAARVAAPHLVLAGRTPPDTARGERLAALQARGATVEFRPLDVTDAAAVSTLLDSLVRSRGRLHGIVHCAGVLDDQRLPKKTADSVRRVLAPKTRGLVHLAAAAETLDLDVFIAFSSVAAVLGNAGQLDYATANAFLDFHVHQCAERARRQGRPTRWLSVNWPLWQHGAMRPNAAVEQLLEDSFGLVPLDNGAAFDALYRALALDADQVAVFAGRLERIRERVLGLRQPAAGQPRVPAAAPAAAAPAAEALHEETTRLLVREAANVLKLRPDEIDLQAQLDTFGFTSIALTEYVNVLNQQLGIDLTPTVFYDYSTLAAFTGYLLETQREALQQTFGAADTVAAAPPVVPVVPVVPAAPAPRIEVAPQPAPALPVPSADDAVAIIGISGAFPMARDLEAFWQNLAEGRDCISEIPATRWDWRALYGDPQGEGDKSNVKWGAFLDEVAEFDPLFFGISPREAECMDPQQRLLLTHAWLAIEDAGYAAQSLSGTQTGVFIGTTSTGYGDVLLRHGAGVQAHTATGLVPSVGPNRLSYLLNLQGPSEPVETACSSALVAVHRGVRALRSGECEMALVGGVNTIFNPQLHVSFNKAGMLSEDGRCKPFSANADGFARGEGVGVMLLKPLHAAERDGDPIHAVIRGTAQNHGGRAKSLTAPNSRSQAELLRRAFADAGVAPQTVGYIEAHGTGTALGDPIEVEGLKLVFRQPGAAAPATAPHCGLGSVKSNIGHLELAAGIAGIFKVLLQLRHRTLVRTLHCDTLNPYLKLDGSPFYVVRSNTPWPALHDGNGRELPRRAGVSSFGFGGTNCHVVLEEYVAPQSAVPETPVPLPIVLSARNPERLRERAEALLAHLESPAGAGQPLRDVAYTLQVGREPMEARLAFVAATHQEAIAQLRHYLAGETAAAYYAGQVTRGNELLALFSGDDELQAAIGRWLEQRKFAKLLRLWVQGLPVDWQRLHAGTPPRRVHLPGYPFARERYWAGAWEGNTTALPPAAIPAPAPAAIAKPAAQPLAAPVDASPAPVTPALRYLRKGWQPAPAATAAAEPAGGLLILADPHTQRLAEALQPLLPNARICDVHQAVGDHELRWAELRGCIDLVGCSPEADFQAAYTLGLLQRLVERGPRDGLRLLGVTQGLERVAQEAGRLAGATRAALYRMLQCECPQLQTRHVDLDPALDVSALAAQVAREFAVQDPHLEVAYRGGQRLAAAYEELSLRAGDAALAFPPGHVLWVTGGTRGLGCRVAQHFVEHHGVRRLVLCGQSAVPPRHEWKAHLNENTPTGKRLRALHDLERAGAELLILALDLCDPDQVRRGLARVHAELGPVGGVIHCAGAVDRADPAFIRKSPSRMRTVLEPKVRGLSVLHDVLRTEPLQFFACFSSVSAAVPALGVGLSDYAMANAYQDYFAAAHAAESPIVSLQWPSWSESGMRAATGQTYRDAGLLTHDDELGLQLLDQVLAARAGPVILPAQVDAARWNPGRWLLAPAARPVQGPAATPAPVAAPAAAVRAAATPGAGSPAERWLTRFFAAELKIAEAALKPDVPFHEYGMESVMLAQVLARLGRELNGLALDPTAVLENPTIAQLAAFLVARHPELQPYWEGTSVPAEATPAAPATAVALPPAPAVPVAAAASIPARPPAASASRIAVIGLAAHMPDAPDLAAFWDNLVAGVDSIREVPRSRWDPAQHYSPAKGERGKSISKWGAFLDGIEDFDPEFFKIPETLALQMDPLERQWLEVGTEALADAGYGDGRLSGRRVGVFVGARTANYRDKLTQIDKDVVVGLGQNFIAAHLAHVCNFKGPNLVVDTACASALTAIHLAVESLKRGESEVALAGGVEVLLDESPYVVLSAAQVLSPDGRCKTFDEGANGIGLGEGCAALLLKPLERAIADGDKIYGVIEGSAINNDGHTMGITTPNPAAQSELIEQALAAAAVDPQTISYVETHGTGTLIGDPIELNALTRVFGNTAGRVGVCGVGSVKSNIGHLLSAAGAAGMAKLLLSLVHRTLPPTLHCDRPNPRFNFAQSPLYPVLRAQPWQSAAPVLRAGISSFGLGGNNAHVIVSDENIPAHLRATLVPRGGAVRFNRRRIWPDAAVPRLREPERLRPVVTETDPAEAGLDDFFAVRRVRQDDLHGERNAA